MRRALSPIVVLTAVVLVGLTVAPAGATTPRIFPSGVEVRGADIGTWVERWARYAFEPGIAENPLVNATDCDISIQMVHGVVFLPASGGGTYRVECTVPARHPFLLTPAGQIGVRPYDGSTLQEIRASVASYIANTSQVRVSIDGQRVDDIDRYFVHSHGLFDLDVPTDTILCCDLEPGVTKAYVAGWFLMLRPFWRTGTHRIRAHDVIPAADGSLVEATTQYVLHVEG